MTRQTVVSVCFIFLLAVSLLVLGLTACEQGLKEISGRDIAPGALVVRYRGETVEITVAGHELLLDLAGIKERLGRVALTLRQDGE